MTSRLTANGTVRLNESVDAAATNLELDTGDGWTTAGGQYPMQVMVGGELIQANLVGISTITGNIQLALCDRALNGVSRSHLSGTLVEPASPIKLGLGWAGVPTIGGAPSTPTTPTTPPTGEHTVAFRGWSATGIDPHVLSISATPTLAQLEHPSGGTVYAGGAGTTYRENTASGLAAAMAAAQPGDMILATGPITGDWYYLGNKYGLGGTHASGTAGNPIILGTEGAGEINVASISNGVAAIRVRNADHVWVVGARTRGSQFGIGLRNVEGTSAHPVRVAHCDVADTGDASFFAAGWWQLITSSGGTPPAGAGNERGYSRHVLVEANLFDNPGLRDDHAGECIYFGHGGAPGWISRADNCTARWNVCRRWKSDWLDIKPGCYRIWAYDNEAREGSMVDGAAMQLLYVFTALDDRPAWYDFDPEVFVEGNRTWDGNLTNARGGSSTYHAQSSLCGVRFAFNVGWGFPNTGVGFRLRSEKAASQSQSTDGEKWWVFNNTMWMDTGVDNVGAPAASPTAFSAGLLDLRNNLGPTGGAGFTHTAADTAFIDPAAIPTVDTVDADAEWLTYGPGSAFDLDPDDALVGAGTSISGTTFVSIGQDISQRDIPITNPNPGAFQPHPANTPS